MIKKFLTGIFTVLALCSVASVTAMAEDAADTLNIDNSGNITLTSENSKSTAVKLSLIVEPEEAANISFNFNSDNAMNVTDYRYHEDTKILNVYIADAEPIFQDSEPLDIGTVAVTDSEGNDVDFTVEVTEESLQFVAKGSFVEQTFVVENAIAPETPAPPEDENSGTTVTTETTEETESTTTTTATTATTTETPKDSKYLELEKTFPTSYMITIPDGTSALELNQTFNVEAENVMIEHGKKLKVSVISGNEWNLKDKYNPANKSGVSYTMGYGDSNTAITNNSPTVLTISDGLASKSVLLKVIRLSEPDMAGTFTDTLTFKVDID